MRLGRSNLIFPSCKKQSKSTRNSKHLEVFKACHWNLLYLSVVSITTSQVALDQRNLYNLWFSKFLRSKKHKLREILHREFLQMIHQSCDNWGHTLRLCFYQSYGEHWAVLSRKLHNMKIVYRLLPTYRRRRNHWVVAGYWHIR